MRLPTLTDGVVTLQAFGTRDLTVELAAYRRWMDDEQLRYETGTDEPMSDADIAGMQSKWLEEPDKFDYIIWCDGLPVGDIGYFYKRREDQSVDYAEGEISMMIADRPLRRRGLGRRAWTLVSNQAKTQLATHKVVAKIKTDNEASIKFFERQGFVETSRSEVFDEVTLEATLA